MQHFFPPRHHVSPIRWSTRVSNTKVAATLKAEKLDNILREASLAVWVSWPGARIALGASRERSSRDAEFAFTSLASANSVLQQPSLRKLALAFFGGELSLPGDILGAMPVVEAINVATDKPQTKWEAFCARLYAISKKWVPHQRMRFESLDHYAKSANAYELMLDPWMQYTCGVYQAEGDDLERAQIQKFELINSFAMAYLGGLRGRNHLDIGCGWGGLCHYFANNYCTSSVGLTNSPEQAAYAQRKFNVDVWIGDFSVLDGKSDRFDLITIVGMIEHLTPSRRDELLQCCFRKLAPGGVIYLQCIEKPSVWVGGDAYRLAQKEIFPGHFLETSQQTKARLTKNGFDVLSYVEDGLHYSHTTAAWLRNIERSRTQVLQSLSQREYRVFTGYLALASRLFASGRGRLGRYLICATNDATSRPPSRQSRLNPAARPPGGTQDP